MRFPDRASLRGVLLDAGGVLVRPDFQKVAEVMRARGIPASALALAAAEAAAKRALDLPPAAGTATDEERSFPYFDLVLAQAGIARSSDTEAALADLRAWHGVHNLWQWVPEGVSESLVRLRSAGLKLAVVSNSNGTLDRLLGRLGLRGFFDTVLDSAVEGVEKPDPRLFRMALERLGAVASEVVHVGDVYHVDVVGARAAGIEAILLDEAGLYEGADCPRVASLPELVDRLLGAAAFGVA